MSIFFGEPVLVHDESHCASGNCLSNMAPHDDYVQFLLLNQGARFYVKPIQGNSGDSLIFLGNECLLASLGLELAARPTDADIIVSPGGNPAMWPSYLTEWRRILNYAPHAKLLVGPSTFRPSSVCWAETLSSFGDRCIGAFARDSESYQYLLEAKLPNTLATGLAHDAALWLKDSAWMRSQRDASTEDHVLIAFRDDREAVVGSRIGRITNRFLGRMPIFHLAWRLLLRKLAAGRASTVAQGLPKGKALCILDASLQNFEFFVDLVRRASEVHTDRLHVALFAAMLNKPVTAYPTDYGKIEAVFRHSQELIGKITFVAGIPTG